MSAWQVVIAVFSGVGGTIIVNAVWVPWYLGRKTATYDAFGRRLKDVEKLMPKLLILEANMRWIKAEIKGLGGNAPENGGH
jgi:hypothetical protein